MDVEFSEEQERLRQSARELLASECPISLVREMMEDSRGLPGDLWRKMADVGWMTLAVDEAHGGAGLDLVDLCILLEEMGRVLLPAPYFSSIVVGATALDLLGTDEQKRRWLGEIISGERVVALAQLEASNHWGADGISMGGRRSDGGYLLEGTKHFVLDAPAADLLLVPVRDAADTSGTEGISLLLVDAAAAGLAVHPVASLDPSRKFAEIRFDEVRVEADRVLAAPGLGWDGLRRVHDVGRVALCAQAVGGAEAVLEMTVAYVSSREQFGRPIGAFQAIQHQCADMLIELESARSATYYAAWSVANDEPDAHVSACMARSFCAEAFPRICGAGIQLHGGLGFTWEHDLHLYYKRAKVDELLFGDATWNRELVARELLDGGATG